MNQFKRQKSRINKKRNRLKLSHLNSIRRALSGETFSNHCDVSLVVNREVANTGAPLIGYNIKVVDYL